MKTRLIVRILALLTLVTGIAIAYDGNPPESTTGAPAVGGVPAEGLCSDCHNDFTNNTGGSIALVNAPAYYTPGTAYTMIVRLTSSQTAGNSGRVWGFQLTAVRASDGTGVGTFANVAGQGTTIVSGAAPYATRRYIEVSSGNRSGVASPVEWQVQWTAPNPGVGQVRFYMSGVAANGAAGNNGDWVYNSSFSSDDVTPVMSSSWGDVKTRYRR